MFLNHKQVSLIFLKKLVKVTEPLNVLLFKHNIKQDVVMKIEIYYILLKSVMQIFLLTLFQSYKIYFSIYTHLAGCQHILKSATQN